jgi:hypothetical protein
VRTVVSEDGRVWDVWPVRPKAGDAVGFRVEYAGGWLAFGCGSERMRFSPLPDDWETMPREELLRCLSAAHAPDRSNTDVLNHRGVPRG